MEDGRIVQLYWDRDQSAISATAEKYEGYCASIARNILGDERDAEECVNDTWYAAWTRMPPELPQCLRAFLGRITRNLSISRFRSNRAQKRYSGMEVLLSELDDCVPAPRDVEQVVDQKRLSALISGWLDGLAEDDRVLFVRRYWHGDAVKDLAKGRGCTANQMAQRMLRLRRSLKAFLESEGVCL